MSNPPYLPSNSYHKLQRQVKLYEDRSALVGGKDGLRYVAPLVESIREQQSVQKDFIGLIEYDGSDVSHLGAESNVILDQYDRRRYLLFP